MVFRETWSDRFWVVDLPGRLVSFLLFFFFRWSSSLFRTGGTCVPVVREVCESRSYDDDDDVDGDGDELGASVV